MKRYFPMKNMKFLLLSTLPLVWLLILNPFASAKTQSPSNQSTVTSKELEILRLEELSIIGEDEDLGKIAGSAQVVDEKALERDEYDNIHRVLNHVPGVNVRGEDGYGLRPNIGLRGSTTERSQKITLMEDGVLIAPAPYSAPAAYYFPMVSRMTAVEVVKGPSAIANGPNTVGGSINLITRPAPFESEGGLDIGYGSDAYRKAHLHYGNGGPQFAWLLEGLHIGTDGFKNLDTGGDTGFEKNNVMLKLLFNTDLDKAIYQQVNVKLNYADERSDETYLGLSEADFAKTPYRRYAASEKGLMEWEHKQVQVRHFIEFNADLSFHTTVYRHEFERSWRKLNRFQGEKDDPAKNGTLSGILADRNTGNQTIDDFFSILRGEKDSDPTSGSNLGQTLLVGTNAREYVSQGIQTVLKWRTSLKSIEQKMAFGLRYHEDEIQRNHTEDGFNMTNGRLVTDKGSTAAVLVNDESAKALSAYLQDEMQINKLTLTLGLRLEDIRYQSLKIIQDDQTLNERKSNSNSILLPGIGAFYQLTPTLGLLAGVHKGFVPTGPGQADDVDPEESVNYELGLRHSSETTEAEVIGFFNNYSNLKGVCGVSASCGAGNIGDAVNGGKVHVYGIEARLAHEWQWDEDWRVPFHLTYSFTESEFQNTFNTDFSLWAVNEGSTPGTVQKGDHLPYMPKHKVNVSLSLAHKTWEGTANVSYTGKQLEQSGSGGPLEGATLKAYTVVDLAGRWDFKTAHTVYLKIDNALDKTYLLSRRPFGARPGKPQTFGVGYKYTF